MAEIDPRDLVSSLDGDEPTPEFVANLENALITELKEPWSADPEASNPDTELPSPTVTVDSSSHEAKRRSLVWAAVAAAAVVAVVGLVALTMDDEQGGTETFDQPDDAETVPDQEPPPASPTTSLPAYPDFGFTVIDSADLGGTDRYFFGDGEMWAGTTGESTVSRVDAATGAVLATVDLPMELDRLFGHDGGDLWVSHGDMLSRIDRATAAVTATIDLEATPVGPSGDPDDLWYQVTRNDRVRMLRIDKDANNVAAIVDVDMMPATYGEGAEGVWLGDGTTDPPVIVRIDPATNTVVARLDRSPLGGGFAVGPDAVWAGQVTELDEEPWVVVDRIDPETNTVSDTIRIAPFTAETTGWGIYVTAGSVWVRHTRCPEGEECRNAVARIDPATYEIVAVRDLPADLDISPFLSSEDALWFTGDDVVARVDFSPAPSESPE